MANDGEHFSWVYYAFVYVHWLKIYPDLLRIFWFYCLLIVWATYIFWIQVVRFIIYRWFLFFCDLCFYFPSCLFWRTGIQVFILPILSYYFLLWFMLYCILSKKSLPKLRFKKMWNIFLLFFSFQEVYSLSFYIYIYEFKLVFVYGMILGLRFIIFSIWTSSCFNICWRNSPFLIELHWLWC